MGSFAFWIYPTSGGDSSQAVLGTDTIWKSIKLRQSGGCGSYVGITNSADDCFGTISPPLDSWRHVVIVSTGTEVRLYINGNYQSNLTTTSAKTLGLPLHRLGNTNNGPDRLSGRLDELLIFDTILYDSTVYTLYSSY